MARIAISGAYKNELKISFGQKIKSWFELRYFDFKYYAALRSKLNFINFFKV